MAKLADALGWGGNPFVNALRQNSNALVALGTGIASGRNPSEGAAMGLRGFLEARPFDAAQVEADRAREEIEANNAAVRAWGQSVHPDIAQLPPEYMMQLAAQREQARLSQAPAGPAFDFMNIDGNLVRTDANSGNFDVLGQFGGGSEMRDPPAGYQWNPDGTQSYIPGGPADPNTPGRTTEGQRRNQQLASVIEPELAIVERNWAALSDLVSQAAGSNPVTYGASSPEYQQASNSLRTIIRSYLYSVSGAAATDAEVEGQMSILTPRPWESPEAVAQKLERVRAMVGAVVNAGTGGVPQALPQQGGQWTVLGVE